MRKFLSHPKMSFFGGDGGCKETSCLESLQVWVSFLQAGDLKRHLWSWDHSVLVTSKPGADSWPWHSSPIKLMTICYIFFSFTKLCKFYLSCMWILWIWRTTELILAWINMGSSRISEFRITYFLYCKWPFVARCVINKSFSEEKKIIIITSNLRHSQFLKWDHVKWTGFLDLKKSGKSLPLCGISNFPECSYTQTPFARLTCSAVLAASSYLAFAEK